MREIYDQLVEKSRLSENIFSKILKYKTKKFPTTFNVQFIERLGQRRIIASDGWKKKVITLSSKYDYLFELGILSPMVILSIYEVKRSGSHEMFVDNVVINKSVQVNTQIGFPIPFLE